MAYENITYEVNDRVAIITISRPKQLNALNSATVAELQQAADAARDDETVRVVVLTGAGDKAFVAGADIKEMAELTMAEGLKFAEQGHRLAASLEALEKPVIAAINGYALGGGCELAMACDFAYASEKAMLGQPEVNLGIIPGFGGTQRLLRRIPVGVARDLVFSGRSVKAPEALRLGLVNAVYAPDELMEKTLKAASRIADKGPIAVATAKRLMVAGADLPLEAACELERRAFAALFATEDQREGMKAFMEKRHAEFSGK